MAKDSNQRKVICRGAKIDACKMEKDCLLEGFEDRSGLQEGRIVEGKRVTLCI